MPVWALTLLGTVSSVLIKMLMQLLTESFIKRVVLVGLEKIAASTATDADNQLVAEARKAWFPEDGEKEKKEDGEAE